MRERSRSAESKRDLKIRQHLTERSFASSTRYRFDRARWRGLWRMRIQEVLICSIQNIQVLINRCATPVKNIAAATAGRIPNVRKLSGLIKTSYISFFGCKLENTFFRLRVHTGARVGDRHLHVSPRRQRAGNRMGLIDNNNLLHFDEHIPTPGHGLPGTMQGSCAYLR